MSNTKKILTKLSAIESKLDEVLSRLNNPGSRPASSSKKASQANVPNVKVGKVVITEYEGHILITGDTFDIRNEFKVYRGKWDGDSKGWKIMRSNLSDYEDFKENLKKMCTQLQISVGQSLKSSGNTKGSEQSDDGDCMIMDSTDSDSE